MCSISCSFCRLVTIKIRIERSQNRNLCVSKNLQLSPGFRLPSYWFHDVFAKTPPLPVTWFMDNPWEKTMKFYKILKVLLISQRLQISELFSYKNNSSQLLKAYTLLKLIYFSSFESIYDTKNTPLKNLSNFWNFLGLAYLFFGASARKCHDEMCTNKNFDQT